MAVKPKILAFAGSTCNDSDNKKLVKIPAAGAMEGGADVTVIDLRDFEMPLYVGTLEGHTINKTTSYGKLSPALPTRKGVQV